MAEENVTSPRKGGLSVYGTNVLMNITESIGALPAKNSQLAAFGTENAEKISGEYVREHILVDEPTAGLAKLLSQEVYQMLVDLRDRDGLTIILVDQEIRQALKIADYVYVLDLGRNKFDGPVEEFTDLEKAFWA